MLIKRCLLLNIFSKQNYNQRYDLTSEEQCNKARRCDHLHTHQHLHNSLSPWAEHVFPLDPAVLADTMIDRYLPSGHTGQLLCCSHSNHISDLLRIQPVLEYSLTETRPTINARTHTHNTWVRKHTSWAVGWDTMFPGFPVEDIPEWEWSYGTCLMIKRT